MTSGEIDILYILEKHGWSSCYLHLENGEIYYMGLTHIFNDPIEELLNALIIILQGNSEADITWYDEPGRYEWKIKIHEKEPHKIEVTISEYTEIEKTDDKKLFKEIIFEVKIKLFCICIMSQMSKIRSLMTEKSYKENRSFPFQTFKDFGKEFNKKYSY